MWVEYRTGVKRTPSPEAAKVESRLRIRSRLLHSLHRHHVLTDLPRDADVPVPVEAGRTLAAADVDARAWRPLWVAGARAVVSVVVPNLAARAFCTTQRFVLCLSKTKQTFEEKLVSGGSTHKAISHAQQPQKSIIMSMFPYA